MFCKNCGKEIQDNANFCRSCGTKVTSVDDESIKCSDIQPEKTDNNCKDDINPEINDFSVDNENNIAQSVKSDEERENEEKSADAPVLSDTPLQISDDNVTEKQAVSDEKVPSELICETEKADAAETKNETKKDEKKQIDSNNEKRRGSKFLAVLLRITAIVVAAILFVLIVSTSLYGALYSGFNPKSINAYIDKAEIGNIVVDDKSLAELIYEKCDGEAIEHYNITINGIEEILNKADANSAVSDIVMPYVEYYFGLSDRYPENPSQIVVQLIKNNEDTIESALNYHMDDDDYNFISEQAQTAFAEVSTFIESNENKMLRMVSRRYLYVAMIVAAVIFGLLLFVTDRFKMIRTLGDIGGVMIASAAFMLIVLGYVSLILVFPFMPDYILEFTGPIQNAIAIRTLVFAAVGFLLSVIYWSVSAIKRKKQKNLPE